MSQLHTPAVSLAIIDDFQVVEVAAFGLRKAGETTSVTEQTAFQAGSVSKSLLALAVMRLVEEGKLDLDEDINRYLTSWKVPSNNGWQPRITLRQILSHSAGLTVHGFPGYQKSETVPSVTDILDGKPGSNTPKVEVNILPGLQTRYSGGGFTIAQLALCDVTKESFASLMNRLVLQPLGMNNSTFENPIPASWQSEIAVAHPSKGIPLTGDHHVYPEMAAAGLWTTPSDLATLGLMLLKTLRGDETQFLSKASIDTMLAPVLTGAGNNGGFAGLGFFCSGADEQAFFGHDGWDEGFVAETRYYKSMGKGAVIMVNSNDGWPLLEEITAAIADEFSWPKRNEAKQTVTVPNLQTYAGSYQSDAGQTFTVSAESNSLSLKMDQQQAVSFRPLSDVEFESTELNTKLRFTLNKSNVVSLCIEQDGCKINSKK